MNLKKEIPWEDHLHEACGVIGIHNLKQNDVARSLTYGLVALQHRGQESAGIAVEKEGRIAYHKKMGLVREVMTEEVIDGLSSGIGIGHVRYSTAGESHVNNAQPLVVQYKGGQIALAHNGNLVNALQIRSEMEEQGAIFQTSIDSEVIANLISRNYKKGCTEAVIQALGLIQGAFALVILCEKKLVGVRDPYGLRPLILGKLGKGYVLASESCALDVIGAKVVRDIEPGEMVVIDEQGIQSINYTQTCTKALCAFEYVYFARPDSDIENVSVYESRHRAGQILAQNHSVKADIVMAVPDSGTPAAVGYAEASGIPFGIGLIKNKYLGRTFIEPSQQARELAVRLKLNVLKANVKGKKLVLVDDSLVRGTTMSRIVTMLKKAGALEIHVRISSPPVKHSCYFGIDTPSEKQLVGSEKTVEEICNLIGADSLGYLDEKGLMESIGRKKGLCTACFSGCYPMAVPKKESRFVFEKC